MLVQPVTIWAIPHVRFVSSAIEVFFCEFDLVPAFLSEPSDLTKLVLEFVDVDVVTGNGKPFTK